MIESTLEKVGRIIGNQYGINVRFEANAKPHTDGENIILPKMDGASDEVIKDLNGFLDHEVAHCMFTDMKAMTASGIPNHLKEFTNAMIQNFEDHRIEKRMIEEYPGCELNLGPLNDKFDKLLKKKYDDMPWFLKLVVAVRNKLEGNKLKLNTDEISEHLELIKDDIKNIYHAKSTKDIRDISCKILNKVRHYFEEPPKEESKDESQDSDESKESEDKSEDDKESEHEKSKTNDDSAGGGASDNGGDDDANGSDSDDTKQQTEEQTESKTDEKIEDEIREALEENDLNLGDFVKSTIKKECSKLNRTKVNYSVQTKEFDKTMDLTKQGNIKAYNFIKNRSKDVVNKMVTTLSQVLQTESKCSWKDEQERGRISKRSLHKLATDNNYKKLFQQKQSSVTKSVAVSLIVDQSGSMGSNSKYEIARESVVAMAECLTRLNIPFEVIGFDVESVYSPRVKDIPRFSRTSGHPLRHQVFKSFNSTQLKPLSMIQDMDNNADGESVRFAANRLLERREKRKVLIVFSDGYPEIGHPENRHAHVEAVFKDLTDAVTEVTRKQIEVIGIGILSNAVERFYPQYVVVNKLNDLKSEALSQMKKILLKRA